MSAAALAPSRWPWLRRASRSPALTLHLLLRTILPAAAARIRARLRRHWWLYYARLQFIWRKLPGLRDLIFFAAPPQVTRYPNTPA